MVAAVWRRSWKRMRGRSSARSSAWCGVRLMVVGQQERPTSLQKTRS
jgi:hypothetical protein